jgi:hypothetical protein
MQTAPIDLHTEEFFEPNVAEMHLTPKMIQERELTLFVGSLEHDSFMPERCYETIGETCVEISIVIKESNPSCTLPRFYHQLNCSCIEPPLSLLDQTLDGIFRKRAGMFLAKFKLNLKPSLICHLYYVMCFQSHIGESFTTFDSRETDVCA